MFLEATTTNRPTAWIFFCVPLDRQANVALVNKEVMDHPEILELMENLETMVDQAAKVNQARMLPMTPIPYPFQSSARVLTDQDQQDPKDQKEPLVPLAPPGLQVAMVAQELTVLLDQLVQLAQPASLALKDLMVTTVGWSLAPLQLEMLALQEKMAPQVVQAKAVVKATLALTVVLAMPEMLVQLANQDLTEAQENVVPTALRDQRVAATSARQLVWPLVTSLSDFLVCQICLSGCCLKCFH